MDTQMLEIGNWINIASTASSEVRIPRLRMQENKWHLTAITHTWLNIKLKWLQDVYERIPHYDSDFIFQSVQHRKDKQHLLIWNNTH